MGCCSCKEQTAPTGDDYVEFGKYVGQRNCIGQRNGKGQYYYDNGDSFDGMWKRNKKHGYGVYSFLSGRRLEGFFDNDKYIGEFAPSEATEDADDPLPRTAGSGNIEEPMIKPSATKETRDKRRKERQSRIEDMKKKYHIKDMK